MIDQDFDPHAPIIGPYGTAEWVPWPDTPDAAETLSTWIITSDTYHPVWNQYLLFVVRLRDDVPGFPEPNRQFLGATHELGVFAMDPSEPMTVQRLLDLHSEQKTAQPLLSPPNVIQQHEATDQEMEQAAALAVWAVCHGYLNPETGDAPERIRENWLGSVTKTLAHLRGEEHAS